MNFAKNLHCPCCGQAFCLQTNRDVRRRLSNLRQPLLFKCGHSFCEGCIRTVIKVQRLINCPLCQTVIELPETEDDMEKLPVDLYVQGALTTNRRKFNFNAKGNSAKRSVTSKLKTSDLCDECSRTPSVWKCYQCSAFFCSNCFDKIHKTSRSLRKHDAVPKDEDRSYRLPSGCSEHSRPVEFFCSDDNELICSHCVVMGSHKGHSVLTVDERNKESLEDIKVAIQDAMRVLRHLRTVDKKLSNIPATTKEVPSQIINAIQDSFRRLHGILQYREHMLIEEVTELFSYQNSVKEDMKTDVADQIRSLTVLLKDAEKMLSENRSNVDAFEILRKLNLVKDLPCVLVNPDEVKDSTQGEKLRFYFDEESYRQASNLGKITGSLPVQYKLLPLSEIPPEQLDDIPDNLSTISDESASASTVGSQSDLDPFSEKHIEFHFGQSNHSTLTRPKVCGSIHQEVVCVTHVKNPGHFFVLMNSQSEKFYQLNKAIQRYGKTASASEIPEIVHKGDMVLARYSGDKSLYRARVINIFPAQDTSSPLKEGEIGNTETMVEVIYIDYGNSEILPLSKLLKMQERFFNYPEFVQTCSLDGIDPVNGETWSEEAITTFASLTLNKLMLMTVIKELGTVLYVDLQKPPNLDFITNDCPASVRDTLVFLELGCFKTTSKIPRAVPPAKFFSPEMPRKNSTIPVMISHPQSLSKFYIQQLGDHARYLHALMFELQELYKMDRGDLWKVYCPRIEMPCIVQYSVDDNWYRGIVTALPGNGQVTLRYVDFGNEETVNWTSIRKIADKFLTLPIQAVPCFLSDVAPCSEEGWTTQDHEAFLEMVSMKPLKAYVHDVLDDELSIILYETREDCDICINALLVKEGFAVSTGPHSRVVEIPKYDEEPVKEPKKISSTSKFGKSELSPLRTKSACNSPSKKQSSSSSPASSSLEVNVSHVISPSCIYVQLLQDNNLERLKKLMNDLQTTYSSMEPVEKLWKSMDVCVAKYSQDKKWYRAKIIDIFENGKAEVRMLDYGYTDLVDQSDLRPITERHQMDKLFAFLCHLSGIQAAGDGKKWTNIACEYLAELLQSSETFYLVKKPSRYEMNQSLPVDLLKEVVCTGGALEPTTIEYHSISEKLLEQGLAIPVRSDASSRSSPTNLMYKSLKGKITDSETESSEIAESLPLAEASSSTENDNLVKLPEMEKLPKPENTESKKPEGESMEETINEEVTRNVQSKTVKHWKPPELPTKTTFKGWPSYVDYDNNIYFHTEESFKKLDFMKSAFSSKYKNSNPEAQDLYWFENQICIAQYPLDKEWYRGRVKNVLDSEIEVFFVDYGNFERLSPWMLRKQTMLENIPQQCLQCQLFGIQALSDDGKWPYEVLDFIHGVLVEKTVEITLKAPPMHGMPLQASIKLLETDIILEDILVEMNFARKAGIVNIPIETPDAILTPYTECPVPAVGEVIPIIITQKVTPDEIFLQRLQIDKPQTPYQEEINQHFRKFLDLIQDLFEKSPSWPLLKDPKPGMACCCQYVFDNNWYRATIVHASSVPNRFTVLFVDYGNTDVVNSDCLRELPEEYLSLPIQAMQCKLHQLVPVSGVWTAEINSKMEHILFKTPILYARIKTQSDPVKIDLLIQTEDSSYELAYQNLIEEGLITLLREKDAAESF